LTRCAPLFGAGRGQQQQREAFELTNHLAAVGANSSMLLWLKSRSELFSSDTVPSWPRRDHTSLVWVSRGVGLAGLAVAMMLGTGCAEGAHDDLAGLSPFVGSWAGQRERVNIESGGHGRFQYVDTKACLSCSMAAMPTADMDFALTSASGNKATGSVTADKYDRTGKPVVMTLTPATGGAPTTISWTVDGLGEGLFCPASNASWCGY
jgi:hypothetical protein